MFEENIVHVSYELKKRKEKSLASVLFKKCIAIFILFRQLCTLHKIPEMAIIFLLKRISYTGCPKKFLPTFVFNILKLFFIALSTPFMIPTYFFFT